MRRTRLSAPLAGSGFHLPEQQPIHVRQVHRTDLLDAAVTADRSAYAAACTLVRRDIDIPLSILLLTDFQRTVWTQQRTDAAAKARIRYPRQRHPAGKGFFFLHQFTNAHSEHPPVDHGVHLLADEIVYNKRGGLLTAVCHNAEEIATADARFLDIRQTIKAYLHMRGVSFLAQEALELKELILQQFKTVLMRTILARFQIQNQLSAKRQIGKKLPRQQRKAGFFVPSLRVSATARKHNIACLLRQQQMALAIRRGWRDAARRAGRHAQAAVLAFIPFGRRLLLAVIYAPGADIHAGAASHMLLITVDTMREGQKRMVVHCVRPDYIHKESHLLLSFLFEKRPAAPHGTAGPRSTIDLTRFRPRDQKQC